MSQQENNQVQDVSELIKVRMDKLKELEENGKDPFEVTKYEKTADAKDVIDHFEKTEGTVAVSYTHLDVYKRQAVYIPFGYRYAGADRETLYLVTPGRDRCVRQRKKMSGDGGLQRLRRRVRY